LKYNQYRFKFYLNATHSIYIDGQLGEEHPHTWEITIQTIKVKEDFITFNAIEKDMEKYLDSFQDRYLNKNAPFITLNPTLENICIYFKEAFQKILVQKGWLLLSIEMSETPTRSYMIDISDEIKIN
jgi:6-pyruvoyltetrahydropterin/6-carboxytetrahydropterin synthase